MIRCYVNDANLLMLSKSFLQNLIVLVSIALIVAILVGMITTAIKSYLKKIRRPMLAYRQLIQNPIFRDYNLQLSYVQYRQVKTTLGSDRDLLYHLALNQSLLKQAWFQYFCNQAFSKGDINRLPKSGSQLTCSQAIQALEHVVGRFTYHHLPTYLSINQAVTTELATGERRYSNVYVIKNVLPGIMTDLLSPIKKLIRQQMGLEVNAEDLLSQTDVLYDELNSQLMISFPYYRFIHYSGNQLREQLHDYLLERSVGLLRRDVRENSQLTILRGLSSEIASERSAWPSWNQLTAQLIVLINCQPQVVSKIIDLYYQEQVLQAKDLLNASVLGTKEKS